MLVVHLIVFAGEQAAADTAEWNGGAHRDAAAEHFHVRNEIDKRPSYRLPQLGILKTRGSVAVAVEELHGRRAELHGAGINARRRQQRGTNIGAADRARRGRPLDGHQRGARTNDKSGNQ
jgi:hypothetical protein